MKSINSQPWRILLVDDDHDDYLLTRALLQDIAQVIDLSWAENYEAALRSLEQQVFDVALVDYDLGPQNGVELIGAARDRGSRTPMILLTGRGSYEVDIATMQAGGYDYLPKGDVTPQMLERSIRYAIDRRKAEVALQQVRDELEDRVEKRTQELQAAYQSLEARQDELATAHEHLKANYELLDRTNQALREEIAERERVEDSLRERESRLNLFLEQIPAIVWTTDQNLVFTSSRGKGLAELNLQPDQLRGVTLEEFVKSMNSSSIAMEAHQRALQGETVSFEAQAMGRYYQAYVEPLLGPAGETNGSIGLALDHTERRKAEQRLSQYTERTQALADLSQALAEAGPDDQRVLETVVQRISELIGDACVLNLTSPEGEFLDLAAFHHPDPQAAELMGEMLRSATVKLGEGIAGAVASDGKARLVPQLTEEMRAAIRPEFRPYLERFGLESILVVPLRMQGKVIGTLGVSRNSLGEPYTEEDEAFLQNLADRAALAVANARLFRAVQNELIERWRVEAALKASMVMFEGLFESAPDPILLIDREGIILRANRRTSAVFGYEVEDLIGQPAQKLIPVQQATQGQPVGIGETGALWGEALLPDPLTEPVGVEMDLFGVRKDGSELPIDLTLSPFQQEDESAIICVVRDISRRKKMEQKLRENEARFRTVFEESALGIALKTLDGRIISSNPALQDMLGYTREELRGMSYDSFTYPADIPAERELFNHLSDGSLHRYRMEKRYVRKDGGLVWARLAVSLVEGDGGKPLFAVIMVENITERKQMEAELAEVRRRLLDSREDDRLELARDLHDGPMQELYAVIYQLDSRLDDDGGPEQKKGDPGGSTALVEKVENAQQHLMGIVQELRNFCGELRPPTLTPFGLEATIQAHAEIFQQKHPELTLNLKLQPDGQSLPEPVRLALFRIYQAALANVVRHARASRVVVRFNFDAEQIYLEIEDDGRGFQVPPRWIDLVRSGHLGLAGMAERAEAVGGILKVYSQPDKGTKLRVIVPMFS